MGITQLITALVLGFAVSALLTWREIPLLKKNQFKQYIREEGPESHKKKSGTPTMGGLSMIAALIIVTIVLSAVFHGLTGRTWVMIVMTLLFGAVLMVLGVVGEYLGKAILILNNTPQYIVRKEVNIKEEGQTDE